MPTKNIHKVYYNNNVMGGSAINSVDFGGISDPDAIDWINRVYDAGSSVNNKTANAVDTFILGCKSDGIWDSIKACCLLCGANTLEGALVPLNTPYGPELWDGTATPFISNVGGSVGVWDSETQTMSSAALGSNDTFPRFRFSIGLVTGKRYRVTARLSMSPGPSGTPALKYFRVGYNNLVPWINYVEGDKVLIDLVTTALGDPVFEVDLRGNLPDASVTIESLSIREDSFTPTNYNFVEADYNRLTGLKGDGSTKYLKTNLTLNDISNADFHLSAYLNDAHTLSSAGWLSASKDATGQSLLYLGRYNGGSFDGVQAGVANTRVFYSGASRTGFHGGQGASLSQRSYYYSGSTVSTNTYTDTILNSSDSFVVFRTSELVSGQFSDARIAFYSIGESLDLALLDNRVSALITAIQNSV